MGTFQAAEKVELAVVLKGHGFSRAKEMQQNQRGFIDHCIRNALLNAPEAQRWLAPRFSVGRRDPKSSLRSPRGTAQGHSLCRSIAPERRLSGHFTRNWEFFRSLFSPRDGFLQNLALIGRILKAPRPLRSSGRSQKPAPPPKHQAPTLHLLRHTAQRKREGAAIRETERSADSIYFAATAASACAASFSALSVASQVNPGSLRPK